MGIDNSELIDILDTHKGIIFKITNVYTQDQEDRKDLEQEIIIQIWRSLSKFRGHSKISTWIYRIALNVSIAHNRKQKNRARLNHPIDTVIFESASTNDAEFKNDRSNMLYSFISEFDKYNKAILLLYLDDYSYEEIANIIGITKSIVGVKINRIKKRLKNKFATQK